jgi:hypothetical protein
LLHGCPASIALGKVVVKIDPQIFQQAEEGLLRGAQAIEQIAGGPWFASTPCAGWGGRSWVGLVPLVKQAEKLGYPSDHLHGVKAGWSVLASVLGGLFQIQEPLFERESPGTVVFFCQKDQVAQEMPMTTGGLTRREEGGSPSIMKGDPGERGQNPEGLQSALSALGRDARGCGWACRSQASSSLGLPHAGRFHPAG